MQKQTVTDNPKVTVTISQVQLTLQVMKGTVLGAA